MIAGHLEENWEDALDSLELVAKIETDYPEFGPMTPYPGTEAYSKALEEGWIRDFDWSKYYISNPYRVMRNRHFLYQEIYALSLLCTDAARFMTDWKHRETSSWKDLYLILNTRWPVIGLKPIGRLWLTRYMQTRNRAFLLKLSLQQLKWPKRRRLFEDPEDMALILGLRKDPLKLMREPNKMRRIRLLMPVVLERVEDAVVDPFQRAFYACLLSRGGIQG
jgi:radical SAM superfamily enzyme YgiQ (UPF0313 family)